VDFLHHSTNTRRFAGNIKGIVPQGYFRVALRILYSYLLIKMRTG